MPKNTKQNFALKKEHPALKIQDIRNRLARVVR